MPYYIDDAYLASRNPDFLQRALNILVNLFTSIGLKTNVQKMQIMICIPGRIRIQLPKDSYTWMHGGMTLAGEWESRMVICPQCNASVKARSLHGNLADQHNTYPAVVVPADYLEPRASVIYQVHPKCNGKLPCPVTECPGELRDRWMLRHHFWDLHPFDRVVVLAEGYFPRCKRC